MVETQVNAVPETAAKSVAPNSDDAQRGLTAIAGVNVTRDAFLGGALRLYQPERGYRAGTDAVLLAASVAIPQERASAAPAIRVADLGAGVGTVGLCLACRAVDVSVDLIEREAELSEIARHNVLANGYAERVRPIGLDLLGRSATEALAVDGYDHVLANPPFYRASHARAPTDALKAASHVFGTNELDGWARCMARIAKPGGQAHVIYPAENLGDLLSVFQSRFGAITVRALHPRDGQPAIRVIVTGKKGSRAPLTILPPLVLHGDGSAFRPEIAKVLSSPSSIEGSGPLKT